MEAEAEPPPTPPQTHAQENPHPDSNKKVAPQASQPAYRSTSGVRRCFINIKGESRLDDVHVRRLFFTLTGRALNNNVMCEETQPMCMKGRSKFAEAALPVLLLFIGVVEHH